MEREKIDWEKTDIGRLFGRMFLPAPPGMLLASTINIADGVFVGLGVSSLIGEQAIACMMFTGNIMCWFVLFYPLRSFSSRSTSFA